MSHRSLSSICLLAVLVLAGCSEPERALSAQDTGDEPLVEIDTQRYLLASDLLARLGSDPGPLVFDVRAKASFKDSHIHGAFNMPYGQFEQRDVAALANVTPDTPIVTYCGCPHHLAGLAADQLIEWGYTNVRVLYEGFWYWRDQGYPLGGLQAGSVTRLRFAGQIGLGGSQPEGTSVFIRHVRNGQLEAAATDSAGRFETEFHVLGYRAEDRFEVLVGSVDAPVSFSLRAVQGRLNRIPAS